MIYDNEARSLFARERTELLASEMRAARRSASVEASNHVHAVWGCGSHDWASSGERNSTTRPPMRAEKSLERRRSHAGSETS